MSLKSSTKIKQQQHNKKVQATIKLVRKINFSVVVKNVTSKKAKLQKKATEDTNENAEGPDQ